jgi:hypothetical protein
MKCFLKYSLIILSVSVICSSKTFAQHPVPVDMLYQPLDDYFRFSGAGGGSLYGLFKPSGAASGIMSLDANFNLKEKVENAKRKINTLSVNFKIHPFVNSLIGSGDSIDVRRFIFQDNDFRIQFGARFTRLKEREKLPNLGFKSYAQGFADVIVLPFQVSNSVNPTQNKGFTTLSINAGGKFGIITKFMGGNFGISANPQLDMLLILDGSDSKALEEITIANVSTAVLDAMPRSARAYIGGGVKIEVPLNDFIISFDVRKYFKMGNGPELEGLTDNTQFSIGGVATGTIFKNVKKKKSKEK